MNSVDKQKRMDFYLSKITGIPSLPGIVLELIKLIENPMTSTGQIEKLLSKDQGLTLKALQLANSAYYSIPGGATTLARAITYLGLTTLKQHIIAASVFDAFKSLDSPQFNLVEFWKHSVATAITAELISKHLKMNVSDEIFVCGLIHDMGKLALLMIDKEDFLKTVQLAKEKNLTFYLAEMEREAPSHVYWGGVLAKKWKLPSLLQAAITDHHSANHKLRSAANSIETNQMIDVVFISNQLIHSFGFGNSGYDVKPDASADVLTRLNLKLDEKEEWYIKVQDSLSHADAMVQELLK
jgi:HD-like signal output (HDOD) protein